MKLNCPYDLIDSPYAPKPPRFPAGREREGGGERERGEREGQRREGGRGRERKSGRQAAKVP